MRQENEIHSVIPFALKTLVLGWGMVVLYVGLNSFGALLLKSQVQGLGAWNFTTSRSYFSYFLVLFSSWKTWISIGAIATATLAWMIALPQLELSRAYPVAIGLNLLIIVGMSFWGYHEPVTLSKIVGMILIFSGVIFLFR